ncbi:ankyrin repeat domain-containing protein [Streptomyces sp. NBC_01408]|uniref:ankyrin repeat domain-containing protein n=1 Tax=Streptomyces sp. NBC_01408 TaxID=2903855 RepID=UPI00224CB131|nr:ankyrin repeat domain-containing protein [Streptomyces sp. NBC_01408]MCX4695288.1 ankyrin repeat domain-containing protein [Streptomyces sp. NBC_01408]
MMRRAELPGGYDPVDLKAWRRIRRYAVPGWMIERATAHRLAGDWRASCAAAAFDVTFDPADMAARYGAPLAEALEDDLRHLAPDLLRWHLPRVLGGHTTIAPGLRIVLAHYGQRPGAPRDPDAPVLSVTTSPLIGGPQRLRLHCAPLAHRELYAVFGMTFTVEDWTTARPLWDARHSAGLRARFGGGAGRLPFFRPDGSPLDPDDLPVDEPDAADPAARAEWVTLIQLAGGAALAFAAVGMEQDLTVPPQHYYEPSIDTAAQLGRATFDLTRLAEEVRRLAAAGAGHRFRFAPPYGRTLELAQDGPGPHGRIRARVITREQQKEVPRLPQYAWRRLPDLELVRSGLITPEELHPLVTAALFPDSGPAAGPPGPALPGPVKVRCGAQWHEVRSRGGVLELPHSLEERQRERALLASGGAVAGCFAVEQSWTTGLGRLPRGLRAEQRELFLRAQHGDTPAVVALLDAGVDPRICDGARRGLLHVLHQLDHEELLPRLLDAGLDLEARDSQQQTPLYAAAHNGGSAALVRAFLAAGSRIDVLDHREMSLSHVVRRYRSADLGFLKQRVDEEYPGIGARWWNRWIGEREMRVWQA